MRLREAAARGALVVGASMIAVLLFEGGAAFLTKRSVLQRLLRSALRGVGFNVPLPQLVCASTSDADYRTVSIPGAHGYLTSDSEIKDHLEALKREGVLLGNTPFVGLATEEARVTRTGEDGTRRLKPSAAFEFAFIRSLVYSGWDPVALTRRRDPPVKDPWLAELLARDAYARVESNHDSDGNRVTLPRVDSGPVVLVVGDSVAYGAGVGDDQTLASHLQRRYDRLRVINAGIPGANTADVLSRLAELLVLHRGQIHAVVYVHCQNDFTQTDTPAAIAGRLESLLTQHGVRLAVLVTHLYVYYSMPDVLRPDPSQLAVARDLVADLESAVRARGLAVVDFPAILERYRAAAGTPLAGFSLYVDHCHFSGLGNALVAGEIVL